MEMRFEYINNVLVAHLQMFLDRSGAENFKYVFTAVYESFLENGGNQKDWEKMFKENPVAVLDIK